MPINTDFRETGFEVRDSTITRFRTRHILKSHACKQGKPMVVCVEVVQHNTENHRSARAEMEHYSHHAIICYYFRNVNSELRHNETKKKPQEKRLMVS
jgi:hypothetical protein